MNLFILKKNLFVSLKQSSRSIISSDVIKTYNKQKCYLQNRCLTDFRVLTNVSVNSTVFYPIVRLTFSCRKLNFSLIKRSGHKSVFDIDTNVKKDVLLYENKTDSFYVLNYLVVGQLIMWIAFAYLYMDTISIIPQEQLETVKILNMTDKKWQIGIPITFAFTGKHFIFIFDYTIAN